MTAGEYKTVTVWNEAVRTTIDRVLEIIEKQQKEVGEWDDDGSAWVALHHVRDAVLALKGEQG